MAGWRYSRVLSGRGICGTICGDRESGRDKVELALLVQRKSTIQDMKSTLCALQGECFRAGAFARKRRAR